MSIDREMIRNALANTAAQANPGVLLPYAYFHPAPTAPCVCVSNEITDYMGALGHGMTVEEWRLWVLENPGSDWLEAQRQMDMYLHHTGPRSIARAFRAADAWYKTDPDTKSAGLIDIRLERYARLPADIQGPNLIDWMGVVYWGVPITVAVRYGYDA